MKEKGGYLAGRYLCENHHTNIGFVRGASVAANIKDRQRGINDALRKNGLEIEPKHILICRRYSDVAIPDLQSKLEILGDDMPTAFFCQNDYNALCLISALSKLGLNVPRDVSVIGFDNVSESGMTTPRLTTINVDRTSLGYAAISRLHDIISGNSRSVQQISIDVKLIKGDTVVDINK